MLELQGITKVYPAGGENVQALKGVDLKFRQSEFVSILGPSGCGKTTLLNIVGGLDHYTDGDLIINGVSTKNYKDRDWDAYRNHSVGFVFQSYNLIPHQTVLQNVELALTLTGVSKAERRERAKKALEQVGLASQLKKRPSEMSGGQMQRVAIARAIVNNPDIILADEPTGALDTETSVQVMEILKNISKDRLVIMVTHNPELAEQYSTRIIRILDGAITSDTAPLTEKEVEKEKKNDQKKIEEKKKKKLPSMKFSTSFGLSLKNLFTKKGRTTLTSFAGSIGIIGISLIYAVSQGTTDYIDSVQEETLSSYPLTLEASHMDMGTLIQTFMGTAESYEGHEKDAVYEKGMMYEMMNTLNSLEAEENDLASFKKYLESECAKEDSVLHSVVSGVQYSYDLDMAVYTKTPNGNIIPSDSEAIMQQLIMEYYGADMSAMMSMSDSDVTGFSSMMSNAHKLWQEMLEGDNGEPVSDLLKKQYDLVYGEWPDEYNEIILVLDENNELEDMVLYALGLKSEEEIDELMQASINQKIIEHTARSWSYQEICDMSYRMVLPYDCYKYDSETGIYTDLRNTDSGLKYLYDNGIELKISGIVRLNEDALSGMMTGAIGYTSDLTKYIINASNDSDVVKAQKESEAIDVISGLAFKDNDIKEDADKAEYFRSYIETLSQSDKADLYVSIMSIPTDEMIQETIEATLGSMSRADMEAMMISAMTEEMGMDASQIEGYLSAMSDEDMMEMFQQNIAEQVKTEYAANIEEQLSAMPEKQKATSLTQIVSILSDEECANYYDNALEFSDGSYEKNLVKLGCVDLESPATINLYASSFKEKDTIETEIEKYNESVDEMSKIEYTDYVGLIMSSVTTIINAITYVLIAFVAVSLIVSSIMIGVITLISVQERTKEIGILRAMGASKKNVSRMFNAETVIIGFTSGALGVLITYLLCIPINIILHSVTGINNLSASLPIPVAIILIVISMLLTLIAGIIPSRSAAKKDPVVALRTE